jgi:hypothetical protein
VRPSVADRMPVVITAVVRLGLFTAIALSGLASFQA